MFFKAFSFRKNQKTRRRWWAGRAKPGTRAGTLQRGVGWWKACRLQTESMLLRSNPSTCKLHVDPFHDPVYSPEWNRAETKGECLPKEYSPVGTMGSAICLFAQSPLSRERRQPELTEGSSQNQQIHCTAPPTTPQAWHTCLQSHYTKQRQAPGWQSWLSRCRYRGQHLTMKSNGAGRPDTSFH